MAVHSPPFFFLCRQKTKAELFKRMQKTETEEIKQKSKSKQKRKDKAEDRQKKRKQKTKEDDKTKKKTEDKAQDRNDTNRNHKAQKHIAEKGKVIEET